MFESIHHRYTSQTREAGADWDRTVAVRTRDGIRHSLVQGRWCCLPSSLSVNSSVSGAPLSIANKMVQSSHPTALTIHIRTMNLSTTKSVARATVMEPAMIIAGALLMLPSGGGLVDSMFRTYRNGILEGIGKATNSGDYAVIGSLTKMDYTYTKTRKGAGQIINPTCHRNAAHLLSSSALRV